MNTFLIIESERSIRQALRLSLQQIGHKVYCTESFSEGCYLVKAIKLDLIVIDDDVLKENTLSEIKIKNTPILILSDYGNGHYKNITSNQIQTIHKPFSLKLFSNKVSTALTN